MAKSKHTPDNNNKMNASTVRNTLLALATGTACLEAATISHISNTTITSDAALDQPEALFAGATLEQAVTYGGSAQTVNTTGGQTIPFALGTLDAEEDIPAPSSSSTVLYNGAGQSSNDLFPGSTGDTQFDSVLRSNAWHNNASDAVQPLALRVAGLTVGQEYLVSLFSADARSADRSQAYWDTFDSGTFSGGTSGSFSQNPATMSMLTFTADAEFQDIYIQETDGIDGDDTHLSGFTLHAVPEPTAPVLLAGGLMLLGLRRRRA